MASARCDPDVVDQVKVAVRSAAGVAPSAIGEATQAVAQVAVLIKEQRASLKAALAATAAARDGGMPSGNPHNVSTSLAEHQEALGSLLTQIGGLGSMPAKAPNGPSGPADPNLHIDPTDHTPWWKKAL